MTEDFIKQVLSILGKDLHIKENSNFIETLFEERAEKFHIAITKDDRYKKEKLKMKAANNHIIAKYDNAMDIINSMEEYADANGEMSSLIKKQMYKHGVYNGMCLILDGLHTNYIQKRKQGIFQPCFLIVVHKMNPP